MATPEAKLPHAVESTQTPISLPIHFEYTGNYSNAIFFNDAVLRQLADIMGAPRTTLVIKDGREEIERTGIIVQDIIGPFMNGSEETLDRKKNWSIRISEEKQRYEILINSKVIDGRIDGRIREFHPAENYEMLFLQTLEEIILRGIFRWASYEMQEKGLKNLFKNRRKHKELMGFFLEHGVIF